MSPGSEINSDSTASAYDSEGNAWEFIVSSSDIDQAIDSWTEDSRADYRDYKTEQQYEDRYR